MHQSLVFEDLKTVAIVGLSDKPDRPSYQVAEYMKKQGFRVIPVNPNVKEVMGEKSYPSILEIPDHIQIDVVDIFRNSENVMPHVREAVDRGGVKTIWLQEGVVNHDAERLAHDHNIHFIMNSCLMDHHKRHTK